MSQKFETMESAIEAQKAKATQVKDAKVALTEYFKENKLKKSEDYTDDAKHGKKVTRLEGKIDKYSDELNDINESIKKMKPGKKEKSATPKNLKYDYPEDVKTSEQRKKYRIEKRKEAKSGEATSTKKTSKASPSKEVAEVPEKKVKGKSKAKSKVAESPEASKTKSKSKRRREVEDEGDDD